MLETAQFLVPFIGAGFSQPACPTWAEFLETYFDSLRGKFLRPGDEEDFRRLKENGADDRFEKMAGWLLQKSEKGAFKKAVKTSFGIELPQRMTKKFDLLHKAFPGLKITTNYDQFIENTGPPGDNVEVVRGSQKDELQRILGDFTGNSLVKVHGGVKDMTSIVLTAKQYEKLYGHPAGFDPAAPLPVFLEQSFCRFPVLFIGCSLVNDRTLQILENLPHKQPHFALMQRAAGQEEKAEIYKRLSGFDIEPVWFDEFEEIEDVLQKLAAARRVEPVSLPLSGVNPFVGREKELRRMEEILSAGKGGVQTISGRLFNLDGAGGVGKTTLALEAASRFGKHFPDGVLPPVRADEHTPASFAMHVARLLKQPIEEPADAEEAQALITALLKERRLLLVLDNAVDWKDLRFMLPMETAASIIVTTRDREMHKRIRLNCPGLDLEEIALEKFTKAEALDLFRRMLADEYNSCEQDAYLQIACNVGFLPIALRQAITLMLFGPNYPASVLLEKLQKEDRLDVLRRGALEDDSDERAVEAVFDLSSPLLHQDLLEALQYLSVCAPGPAPLDFLRRLSGDKDVGDRFERLYRFSWCERRQEGDSRFYELHQLVRELAQRRFDFPNGPEFVSLVHEIFTAEEVHFSRKDDLMPQLEEAFSLAVEQKNKILIKWMYRLYYFCAYRGYSDFYLRLSEAVEKLFPNDRWALRTAYAHRGGVLRTQGKLDEAMVMYKKDEKIKNELGDRAGLAACYNNQGSILYQKGELENAMRLYKKQERTWEELGDRAKLSACYGNQALILRDWGQLEDAMALHNKEEKICEEFGDRAGLSRCYGNQGSILYKKGELEDAMRLYKEQEKICDQLGDRAGLSICWWNQGIIWGDRGDGAKKIALWQKAIATNKAMGIPTAEDEAHLEKLLAGRSS